MKNRERLLRAIAALPDEDFREFAMAALRLPMRGVGFHGAGLALVSAAAEDYLKTESPARHVA